MVRCGCGSGKGSQVAIWGGALVVLMGAALPRGESGQPAEEPADAAQPAVVDTAADDPVDVLGFTMSRIDGKAEKLADYRGKVVMIVNTASKCGFTPQYEALEKVYRERKDRGFVVLGFPANDFRRQEPGTNEEILEFCTERFGVTFPMFEKVVVTGEDACPLYKKLAAQPEPVGGEPKWNFTKYLVDKTGRVRERFEPNVKPDDERVIRAIEKLLGEKADDQSAKKPAPDGDG